MRRHARHSSPIRSRRHCGTRRPCSARPPRHRNGRPPRRGNRRRWRKARGAPRRPPNRRRPGRRDREAGCIARRARDGIQEDPKRIQGYPNDGAVRRRASQKHSAAKYSQQPREFLKSYPCFARRPIGTRSARSPQRGSFEGVRASLGGASRAIIAPNGPIRPKKRPARGRDRSDPAFFRSPIPQRPCGAVKIDLSDRTSCLFPLDKISPASTFRAPEAPSGRFLSLIF